DPLAGLHVTEQAEPPCGIGRPPGKADPQIESRSEAELRVSRADGPGTDLGRRNVAGADDGRRSGEESELARRRLAEGAAHARRLTDLREALDRDPQLQAGIAIPRRSRLVEQPVRGRSRSVSRRRA